MIAYRNQIDEVFEDDEVSCPEIAIHKKSVYGNPRTRNLCFTRAQAEPL